MLKLRPEFLYLSLSLTYGGRKEETWRRGERERDSLCSSLPRGIRPQTEVLQFPSQTSWDCSNGLDTPPLSSQIYLQQHTPSLRARERERGCPPTSAHNVPNASFFPLEKIASFPTAEVQDGDVWLDVRANEYTLHPVIEVPHVEYGAL